MSARRVGASLIALGWVSFHAPAAHADVASWMFVGPGWSRAQAADPSPGLEQGSNHTALLVDAGFGTHPGKDWVVGGVFHAAGYFGYGSDWGGALRVTTGGYSRGTWGLGLDVGPQYRFGDQPGPVGSARLLFGAPWGLALSAGGGYGADEVATFTVALGIDLARLTVHRTSGLDWFPNPHPSPTREYTPAHPAAAGRF